MVRWNVAVVLLATTGGLALAQTQTTRFSHSGKLVDASDGHAIVGGQAKAWRAQNPNASGPCPAHTDLLSDTQTGKVGQFEFQISSTQPTYFAQYCANGYATKHEPGNDNNSSGPVNPDPVLLINPNTASVDDMYQAVDGVLGQAGSDLRQLARKNPNGFSTAQESLPGEDRNAVMELGSRRPSGEPRGSVPQDPRAGINWILNDAASNLKYFSGAVQVRGGFNPTLQRFSDSERAAIDWLLKRPRSVVR